jgi:hypothetical protein
LEFVNGRTMLTVRDLGEVVAEIDDDEVTRLE